MFKYLSLASDTLPFKMLVYGFYVYDINDYGYFIWFMNRDLSLFSTSSYESWDIYSSLKFKICFGRPNCLI